MPSSPDLPWCHVAGTTSFGFSYPFDIDASVLGQATQLLSAGCEPGAYVQPEWLNFLLVGGYCYFGEGSKLLGANALSPRGEGTEQEDEADVELVLVGPYDCAAGAGEAMRTAGRLQKVTVESLKGAGTHSLESPHRPHHIASD